MADYTNLYSGYNRASSFNPVPRRTLVKALKPYSIKLGSLKGQSDLDLRRRAIAAVLAKHKLS